MKKFALIGAGGFIAPRHMKAMKDTGCQLMAAIDKHDSVGVIDSYFPEASFFTEFERFDRHVEKLKKSGSAIDYFAVCSPNYLHDAHCRFGLRYGADVICEKPLVLNPWNLDALEEMEKESGKKVYTILQLRLHPNIIALKKKVEEAPADKVFEFDLTYITSRGSWYYTSWKGDIHKSGGIATNIGVHFFDMLTWIFGDVKENIVHVHTHDRAGGLIVFEKARVKWFLSINEHTLPEEATKAGKRTFRSIKIEGEEIEFSDGFTELHTQSYNQILEGRGYGISDTRKAIELVYDIRNSKAVGVEGEIHPFCALPIEKHPFD
ncbi:MAG: Gfo/Idh/MocA family oxidoreductase [Saprospiraceae bacterium]|nr:Gfo/Idh/MocA family oxidoreductase [Saprospiraceae bacterium]MBK8851330.1 Gfo/Idh/MocA family oxidoreductase [Saprospiraceae bacterium]MBK9688943.1 Gfo/Idh/MocA family oxidoreductase [Saprospiraceae bacterium]